MVDISPLCHMELRDRDRADGVAEQGFASNYKRRTGEFALPQSHPPANLDYNYLQSL